MPDDIFFSISDVGTQVTFDIDNVTKTLTADKYGYEDAAPDVSLRNARLMMHEEEEEYVVPLKKLSAIRKPSNDDRPSLYEFIHDTGIPPIKPLRKQSNDQRPFMSSSIYIYPMEI